MTSKRQLNGYGFVTSGDFVYTGGEHPSSVWGFYDSRKQTYIAPINHKKPGKPVRIEDTTPYTAQLNLNPLMQPLDKMNVESFLPSRFCLCKIESSFFCFGRTQTGGKKTYLRIRTNMKNGTKNWQEI